jgi:pyruvate,orthophosphate dikinase
MVKRCYFFGDGQADGSQKDRNLLGGKGANLAEMIRIGLPVPPGFTITTDTSIEYTKLKAAPAGLFDEVREYIAKVEKVMDKQFGNASNPLLLAIRSGARVSMPGMMDTVLNCGLNDETVEGLAKLTGDERFAFDSYRRLIQMYSDIVLELPHSAFEKALEDAKSAAKVSTDKDLTPAQLRALVDDYKQIVTKHTGKPFPQDPWEQLFNSTLAVFSSWMNDRAVHYRDINGFSESWGTAVTVMAMVFGNMGEQSCTGVAFTRDPSTGENRFYGEFLTNAQGEDVVAGIRTPQPLMKDNSGLPSLEEIRPQIFKELCEIRQILEDKFKDMQDIEFTVQEGKTFMLQTRNAKRTAASAVRTSVEMFEEGLIDKKTALLRVSADDIESMLHPQLDKSRAGNPIGKGLPASPGGATGKVVFSAQEAERRAADGEKVLLVRIETSPEDLRGMTAAQGILTARGGMTSHAAVVTRQMGKPCVCGLGELQVDLAAQTMTLGGKTFGVEETITIDGSTGEVYGESIERMDAATGGYFAKLMAWADEMRSLGVMTNADNGKDAKRARDMGAEGIGLVRTEHMFFEGERIHMFRQFILAPDEASRTAAISELQKYQQADFEDIFEAMDGLPVTVRLLDPPLHEFLPTASADIAEVASRLKLDSAAVHAAIERLHESNPMLGHRGCRLGITFPNLYNMQVRAIVLAAIACGKKGIVAKPKIMVPLVSLGPELELVKKNSMEVIESYKKSGALTIDIAIGTMIELPRACVMAHEIAKTAEFFSFGTNDLTQTTFGISRDDSNTFLPDYKKAGLVTTDPFAVLDPQGVGGLIKIACEGGRSTRRDLNIGICGEHGGNPQSIEFAHSVGLIDYVSCSPLRVPVARMAAAHAAIKAASVSKL